MRWRDKAFVAVWGIGVLTYIVGDTLTTYLVFQFEGTWEANPIAAKVLSMSGFPGLIVLKILGVLLFMYSSYLYLEDKPHVSIGIGMLLVVFGGFLTLHNYQIIQIASSVP